MKKNIFNAKKNNPNVPDKTPLKGNPFFRIIHYHPITMHLFLNIKDYIPLGIGVILFQNRILPFEPTKSRSAIDNPDLDIVENGVIADRLFVGSNLFLNKKDYTPLWVSG